MNSRDEQLPRPPELPLAEGDRLDTKALVEALRAMRTMPRHPSFWDRYGAGLSQLCRAQGVLILRRESPGGTWNVLCARATPGGALAGDGTSALAQDLFERAANPGVAWLPVGGALVAAVVIPQPGMETLALLEFPARERARINELLVRALLVADVPVTLAAGLPALATLAPGDSVMLMDIVARVMQEKQFGAASLQLVNLLAAFLGCEQVALGWRDGAVSRVLAVSHIDRFENKTEVVQLLEAVFDEAVDQRADIQFPLSSPSHDVTVANERLQRRVGFGHMTTLVIGDDSDEAEPVMTVFLASNPALDAQQLHGVSVIAHLLRPWLLEQQERSRWWGQRLLRAAKRQGAELVNPKSPVRNISAAVLSLLLAGVVFGTWPYRIEAAGELSTDSVQVISAPFDGFLAQTARNLGDSVVENQVLARLDVRDLRLQIADLQSELQRNDAEADRARSLDQVADTAVAEARARQAQARLERAQYQLDQSEIRAPFAGVIVEGERQELAGTPVRQGDKLFRLARTEALYAVIHVSERDIRDVPAGAQGRLRLLAQPNQEIGFRIETIVPVAKVVGGQGNRFTVRVLLDTPAEAWWRPGMSGLALIDAGPRRIIWIWTHNAVDAVRLWLWW
jgi:RND family efflux transporter MFP subunit